MSEEKRRILGENLMMLYTGKQRKSAEIHSRQMKETGSKVELYRQMKDLAASLSDSLSKGRIEDTGKLLHENWLLKRQLASGISDDSIDAMYKSAMESGATGGKLLGAGGGGFLIDYGLTVLHSGSVATIVSLAVILLGMVFQFVRIARKKKRLTAVPDYGTNQAGGTSYTQEE
jgi:galactokinase/mevalonate kinase-like predicted kinase